MSREQARLYGIDPLKVKTEKQRELRRDLGQDDESNALRSEIAELAFHPQRIRLAHHKTKLVTEGNSRLTLTRDGS